MDDSGYIFNPYQWKKDNLINLTDDQISKLDERYINEGENIPSQNVDNLNIINLHLASSGKIYFATDSTEQTTAFNPSVVTQQINNFLSSNNTFTGDNTFTKIIIKDATTDKTSQITETDSNLNIENNNISGSIILKLKNGAGVRNVVFDQFGNLSGANDINCSRLRATDIRLNSNAYQLMNDGFDNFAIINNVTDKGIKLISKTSSSTTELLFDSNGDLYIPSQILSTSARTTEMNIQNVKMNAMGNNFIIDNNNLASALKFQNYDINGNQKILTIDSNLNILGANDIRPNRLVFPYTILSNPTVSDFLIEHYPRGGNITIRNYDDAGLLKELKIQKNMNVTGINDLYVQRLFLNNTLLDFTKYDEMLTNTRLIKSSTSSQTSIEYSTGRFLFLPLARSQETSRNGIIKPNDNVLLGYDAASMTGNNVLTLCPWTSSTNLVGIRATPSQTELYKPKIMDSLKFSDDTTQTTAMTDIYLENKIMSLINQLNLSNLVPTGTILPYGGNATTPPTGFLGCIGQYVSISTYQNLFNVIGHNFQKGHTTQMPAGNFWLPDLAGAYLKGIGVSEIWGPVNVGQDPLYFIGDVQKYNVGKHRHKYTDRGVDSKTVSAGATTNVVKGSNSTYFTDVETFDENNNLLSEENRPNSIGINYIIKY